MLDPEDEGTTILQNSCNYTSTDMAKHPKSLESSTTPE